MVNYLSIENFLLRQNSYSLVTHAKYTNRTRLGWEAQDKERLYIVVKYCGKRVKNESMIRANHAGC